MLILEVRWGPRMLARNFLDLLFDSARHVRTNSLFALPLFEQSAEQKIELERDFVLRIPPQTEENGASHICGFYLVHVFDELLSLYCRCIVVVLSLYCCCIVVVLLLYCRCIAVCRLFLVVSVIFCPLECRFVPNYGNFSTRCKNFRLFGLGVFEQSSGWACSNKGPKNHVRPTGLVVTVVPGGPSCFVLM